MAGTIRYLGLDFFDASGAEVRRAIAERARRGRYGYVVTPNVDHLVTYHGEGREDVRSAYDGAAMRLCDSRVVAGLARLNGRSLPVYPGSDLTRDVLKSADFEEAAIAVLGPDRTAFDALARRYPHAVLTHIESEPWLAIGSTAWEATLDRAAQAPWDVLLICLSFPKQERFAAELAGRGRLHGIALCVGASVDFLTGRQRRAPPAMQRCGLEWLFRLASNPRRMWRRYLVRGPRILALVAGQAVADRRGRAPGGSRA